MNVSAETLHALAVAAGAPLDLNGEGVVRWVTGKLRELAQRNGAAIACGAGRMSSLSYEITQLKDEAVKREEKLETALRELVGFADRNSKRAEAAWRSVTYVDGKQLPVEKWPPEEKQMASRWHEANRLLSVVRDRAREVGVKWP
ncbi:MAG: hypothetical protein EPN91_08755 [Salinibacterium sp.]|nr:MAG: hypothetical protein EPN91_08755 [Salinibacterium sp.]